jgi:drug/metabolite transporter (DMT)-like permease
LPIVKPALNYITPYYFLYIRYLVASLLLLPLLYALWPKHASIKWLLKIISIESIQVLVSLGFLYLGLSQTPALTASLIGSAAPIFTTLAGILILKEREEKREWIGLVISLLGTLTDNYYISYKPNNGKSFKSWRLVPLRLSSSQCRLSYFCQKMVSPGK